jgi:hypothetical protein
MSEEIFPPTRDKIDSFEGDPASMRIKDLTYEQLVNEDLISICDIRYQLKLREALVRLSVVMTTRTKIVRSDSYSFSYEKKRDLSPSDEELERFLEYLRSAFSPFFIHEMVTHQDVLRREKNLKAFYVLHAALATGMAVSYIKENYQYIILFLALLFLSTTKHLVSNNRRTAQIENFESITRDWDLKDFFENLKALYEEQQELQEQFKRSAVPEEPAPRFEEYRSRILATLKSTSGMERKLGGGITESNEEEEEEEEPNNVAMIYDSLTDDSQVSGLRRVLRRKVKTIKPPKDE